MDRQMIFFDIDGTLLDHNKQLPLSAKQAVLALKEMGHEVAIATGRAPFMFRHLREELGIDSYVSYNGQYVVFKGDVIYKNPIQTELLKMLTDSAVARQHPLVYMDHESMKANIPYHPHIEESIRSLKFDHPEYDPHYFAKREIFQSLLFCQEEEDTSYANDFAGLDFIRWHKYSTDVLPFGGSKAQGIARFIEKLGYAKEQVYAFGDGLNDIEMLKFVGNSVAMGNAPDAVKQVAKYVTKDVRDDGLIHGLELVGLLK